jgi:iron complex outermembrane recepter protein
MMRKAEVAKKNLKLRRKFNAFWFWVLSAGFLVAMAVGPAKAETDNPQNANNVFDLGEVVVTEKGETISGVVTVETLSEQHIERANVNNVSDALNTLPGVNVSIGVRNERNINIRGFNQRYVPVFLDGIPLYIPYDGYVDTGSLPVNNISKITLTKGNASVLYGPNTMAGAINLVTKRPQKPFEAKLSAEYIENDSWQLNADVGSRFGKFYTMVSGSYFDSDGYLLSSRFDPTENENGNERNNSDSENMNLSAKVGFLPSEGHDYAFGFQVVDREYGLPPVTSGRARYWRFSEWEKNTYYLLANSRLTDQLSSKIRLYRDEYYNVLDSYDDDSYTTQNARSAWQSTYDDYSNGTSIVLRSEHIPHNTLSFAFHYKEDVHESQGDRGEDWERYEQKIFSYGLENDYKITDALALVVGASYDINKPEYANGGKVREDINAFNPQAGVLWTVGGDWDLHFSVGKKTRFPTLHELYSEQMGRNVPNPDLEEEESVNWELGLNKPLFGHSHITTALFYSEVDNLIEEKELPSGDDQFQNIAESVFQGFEFGVTSTFIPRNEVELHYTYLDAENKSLGRTSDYIEEQSKHKFYLSDLITVTDQLSLFAKAQYNSKRYEEVGGSWEELDDFWVVDAKAIFDFTDNLRLEAGLKNLFDENYEYSTGFPREGRTYFFKATLTF